MSNIKFKPKIDCIFIHIPKTAGMTIYESILDLKRFASWSLGTNDKAYIDKMNSYGSYTLLHIYYQSLLDENYMENDFFKNTFKFCFIRNPYDRIVSLYKYHDIKNRLNYNFDNFIELLYNEYKNNTIPKIGLYNVKLFDKTSKLYHSHIYANQYRQQIEWIPNDIGFIGRLEYFDNDINELLLILGYKGPKIITQKINTSKDEDYSLYYKNNKTRELIKIMYKDDFNRFGYKM